MTRVPLLPVDLAEPAELVQAVRRRRGGTLIELDRMLLHSPPLAAGWNRYIGAVRGELELSPKLRELAILAVAVINGADYEFAQHAPPFLAAGGTQAQLDALPGLQAGLPEAAFDAQERAVVALTAAMTRDVRVEDAVFEAARAAAGSDRLVVELVAVIASYNMVSRFLVALEIHP